MTDILTGHQQILDNNLDTFVLFRNEHFGLNIQDGAAIATNQAIIGSFDQYPSKPLNRQFQ